MSDEVLKEEVKGMMHASLLRNNRDIKADRAKAIIRDSKTIYRRRVEDYALQIEQLKAKREAMLDLSPSHAGSLTPAKDFDANSFMEIDDELGIEIRDAQIRFNLAKTRYEKLYGETFNL
jgi:hypothetical protein